MTKLKVLQGRLTLNQIVTKMSEGQKVEYPAPPKIGVILINTGTPSGFSFWPLWKFLRQFLSDRRISDVPRLIWYPLLYLVILTIRPFTKGPSYKAIWNKEKNESPLRTISRNQAKQLQERFDLKEEKIPIEVEWCFRYGVPSIEEKIAKLHASGCNNLVAFPLFPQFGSPTTASCCDEVFKSLLKQRRQMAVHTVHSYYSNDEYIKAIADSLSNAIECYRNIDFDAIIVTYHGIPLRFQETGDPYGKQCHQTTTLIEEEFKRRNISIPLITTFQSRFGRETWLQPYTFSFVIELAKNNYQNILIIAPGFSSDCLETLEELEMDLADEFRKQGGDQLIYVKCLNDTKESIDLIEHITRKEIQGFL